MKKKGRSIGEIKKDLLDLSNMSCKPSFKRPRTGDVIDEDKSVKWNREEVERMQNAYDEAVKKLNTAKNKRRDDLFNELYEAIRNEVGGDITTKDAEQIYRYAYENNSCGYEDVFTDLVDLIDLIHGIVNHKNGQEEDQWKR